jgi:hypothetical protein
MKIKIIILVMLILGINFCFQSTQLYNWLTPTELEGYPLLLLNKDSSAYIQPIIDNLGLKGYEYVRTLKIKYRDTLVNPIELRSGNLVTNYCSDKTKIVFYLTGYGELKIESIQMFSCKIISMINITKHQNTIFKSYPLDSMVITNLTTENTYVYLVNDRYYLSKVIKQYDNW